MTSTQQRTATQAVTKVFAETVTTEEESTVYMKKLTAIAVSTALYLRGVFDESAYGLRKHENLKLRILSERSDCEAAIEIVNLIKGAFDAISKKYLREMVFGILADKENPDDFIEAYEFKYSYHSAEKFNLSFNNKEMLSSDNSSLATDTKRLLNHLLTMVHSLQPLPEECYFSIKLYYYEDVTPSDYQPPGFECGKDTPTTVRGKPLVINPGSVTTKFHSLSVKMRTDELNNITNEKQHRLSTVREFIDVNNVEEKEQKKKKSRLLPGLMNTTDKSTSN